MKFRVNDDKSLVSTETSGYDLFLIIFSGIIAALYAGVTLWDKWQSRNKGASNEEKIEAFKNSVKQKDLVKLRDQLSKLDETVVEKILKIKCNFTPQMIQADLQLNQNIQKEYTTTVTVLRNKALSLPLKDIGVGKTTLDSEYNKLYGYQVTVDPKDYGVDGRQFGYFDVPKKYDNLLKILYTKTETKSMKELGWNKSNLSLVVDHMIHFLYKNTDFYKEVYLKQSDDFCEKTRALLKKALPEITWYHDWLGSDGLTDDPNDPSNIEKALKIIDQDDGVCAYAYGQDVGFFLESPFSHCIISGHKFASSSVVISMCKEMNMLINNSDK